MFLFVLKALLWVIFISALGLCLWAWYSVRSAPIVDDEDWDHDGRL